SACCAFCPGRVESMRRLEEKLQAREKKACYLHFHWVLRGLLLPGSMAAQEKRVIGKVQQ
ncbi:hypothetical protein KI387_006571, partial [Taxus chinensis]